MKTYKISLHREVLQDEAPEIPMTNSVTTARYLRDHVFDAAEGYRESCHMLLLDKQNHITGTFLLAVGGTDQVDIDLKIACKAAIENLAHGVILSHNHPSGDPYPSTEDRNLTRALEEGGNILGIPLIDHVIIGDGKWYSFKEHGDI